jgi:predicted metal-dependent phosphoesterase TrpH
MSLVTLTDHDTIEGALQIAHLPGTFMSEEVTCGLPGGRELHLGVFGLSEPQHLQIERRRHDAESLLAYLAEQQLPTCVNHLFSALTGRRELEDLHLPLARLALVEVRNGALPAATNSYAERASRDMGLSGIGGSDGHTLWSVARAYTEVPGSQDTQEFLAGLRSGLTIPRGRAGSYATLTADIARIAQQTYRHLERHARDDVGSSLRFAVVLLAVPAVPLIPLVTAGLHLRERSFGKRWSRRFRDSRQLPARRRPTLAFGPPLALETQQ